MNNEKIKELSRFRDEIIKRENWYIRHKKQKTQEKLENATLFLYDFLCDELKKMEQVILDTDDKVKINFSYSEYLCKDINVDKFDMNLLVAPLEFCSDNAAMIASQGYYEFLAGKRADLTLNAVASMPITED